MENIDEYINKKRENAKLYNELLDNVRGVTLPVEKKNTKNVYWLYSILIEDNYSTSRDELIKNLYNAGIESRPFFVPVHSMPPYVECKHGDLSTTMEVSSKGINLPSSVSLDIEDINKVCNFIKKFSIKNLS